MNFTIGDIARITYEQAQVHEGLLLGNSSTPWSELPMPARERVMQEVLEVLRTSTISAADAHARWVKRLAAEGWTYGPTFDEQEKTHPNMLSFARLTTEVQVALTLFRTLVLSLKPYLMSMPHLREPAKDLLVTVYPNDVDVLECNLSDLRMGDVFSVQSDPRRMLATANPQVMYQDGKPPSWIINAHPTDEPEVQPTEAEDPQRQVTLAEADPAVLEEHAEVQADAIPDPEPVEGRAAWEAECAGEVDPEYEAEGAVTAEPAEEAEEAYREYEADYTRK